MWDAKPGSPTDFLFELAELYMLRKTPEIQFEESAPASCLTQIDTLQDAIHSALLALGEGSLEQFEDSLWQQQLLCATLQHSLDQLRLGPVGRPELDRIVASMHALESLSHTYAATIEQAKQSAELLWKLSESYNPALHPASPDAPERPRRSTLCMA